MAHFKTLLSKLLWSILSYKNTGNMVFKAQVLIMVEIRIGDIDSKGKNGGTEYIIDLKPTISAVSVRLVEILDDSSRLRVEKLIDEYVDGLTGAQIKQAMLDHYDEFVARRKGEIKVILWE